MDNYEIKQNPYNFVELDYDKDVVSRTMPEGHHKFYGKSGKIKIKIEALTPIFVGREKNQGKQNYLEFKKREGKYVIPGSSVKGMLRSVAEAIANSCMSIFDGKYKFKHRAPVQYSNGFYKRCNKLSELCITCRIFGISGLIRDDAWQGKIGISDFICIDSKNHSPVFLKILSTPKPYHKSFYASAKDPCWARGRKFYFHRPQEILIEKGFIESRSGKILNYKIHPLNKGSIFKGEIIFENLIEEELSLLIYSIQLEDNMAHKIGFAKPLGFGSIKMQIEEIELYNWEKRFKEGDFENWIEVLKDQKLQDFISKKIEVYIMDKESSNLCQLREILKFDKNNKIDYKYPPREWFQRNKKKELPSLCSKNKGTQK